MVEDLYDSEQKLSKLLEDQHKLWNEVNKKQATNWTKFNIHTNKIIRLTRFFPNNNRMLIIFFKF